MVAPVAVHRMGALEVAVQLAHASSGGSQPAPAGPAACAARDGPVAADDVHEDDGRSIVLALQDESELPLSPPPLPAAAAAARLLLFAIPLGLLACFRSLPVNRLLPLRPSNRVTERFQACWRDPLFSHAPSPPLPSRVAQHTRWATRCVT